MQNISKMAPSVCYCGQSGDITLNMLECAKCRRWFHEECVKCLDLPMLFGDRFYIFICSVCNAGSEYLGRIEMEWDEISHLLLYNLTIIEKKKYFHLEDSIVPFLQDNWNRFLLFGPAVTQKVDIRSKVVQSLQRASSKFKCGKEVKKSKSIWALRVRAPPNGPLVTPSASRLEKDVVVWDFQVKGRAYHVVRTKKSKGKDSYKNAKLKAKLPFASSARPKNGEVSKCRGSVPHKENGIHRSKHKLKRTTVLFNEDSARLGLLDSLIPCPPNFSNCNNPFQKSYKMSSKSLNCQNGKSTGAKKQRTGEWDLTFSNGYHHVSEDSMESTSFFTKEFSLQKPKDDFCIMGKRTTSSGKVQYLFQRNRAKMEKVVAEKEPLFQISFICKCCYCKRFQEVCCKLLQFCFMEAILKTLVLN